VDGGAGAWLAVGAGVQIAPERRRLAFSPGVVVTCGLTVASRRALGLGAAWSGELVTHPLARAPSVARLWMIGVVSTSAEVATLVTRKRL
jgi:hypothetical protein